MRMEPGNIQEYEGAPIEAFNIRPMTKEEQEDRKKENENTAGVAEPIWDSRNQDWD